MQALLLPLFGIVAAAQINTQVQTENGPVTGTYHSDSDTFSYKGIPFAAPPVGNLRFADPAPVAQNWTTPLAATKFADGCMAACPLFAFSRPSIMCTPKVSEDCLYLNVFTPRLPSKGKTNKLLPVIFWIHGGDYQFGSGGIPLYDGAAFVNEHDVVFVTINYRLGVLGALYTGTVMGNFQLKDQRFALQWVQRNIASFGGNPGLVTISGQSAGGISVATHLVSPLSAGLYHRAIMASNPLAVPMANPKEAVGLAELVLKSVSCPKGGTAELECLRKVPAEDFVKAGFIKDVTLTGALHAFCQWMPVVGPENQLPYEITTAFAEGHYNTDVPVMMGTVANESILFLRQITPGKEINAAEMYLLLGDIFGIEGVVDIIETYGLVPVDDFFNVYNDLAPIATDAIFYCPYRFFGHAMAQNNLNFPNKNNNLYVWFYDHISSFNYWLYEYAQSFCDDYVCHAADVPYMFNPFYFMPSDDPAPGFNGSNVPNLTAPELDLVRVIQTAWTNFAITGDPNKGDKNYYGSVNLSSVRGADGSTWPAFAQIKGQSIANGDHAFVYSTPHSASKTAMRQDYCAMWDKLGYNHP